MAAAVVLDLPQDPHATALGLAKWTIRKLLETHVLMNVVTLLAVVQFAIGDSSLYCGRAFVAMVSPLAVLVAVVTVARSVRRESAENEFAAWFRLPPDAQLVFQDGWWVVHGRETGEPDQFGKKRPARWQRSS